MKKILINFLLAGILFANTLHAQNPFKSLGVPDEDVKFLTLSQGRYTEFHKDKDYEIIGSVIIDMKNKKIAGFVDRDTLPNKAMYELETTTRFFTLDRFSEKYVELTPYQYAANNPILYIDVNGDSISVAQEYREQFKNDFQNVFDDNASLFSFSKTDMLSFSGSKKDLTKEQKQVYKEMNKLMKDKDVYSVAYESSYTTKDGSKTIDVDGKDAGGAMFYAIDNAIVISPNNTGGDVISLDPSSFLKNVNVEMNTTTGLFHEFGEALAGNKQYRGSVVDYENFVRKIMKMKTRPYDPYHQPVPPTKQAQ